MAAPGGKLFIQDKLHIKAPHHKSFKDLWVTKWKFLAELGVYPFMFGSAKDFEPIVDEMTEKNIQEPYDWDQYASVFFPKAQELENKAKEAEDSNELEKAIEYYFRSSAVYRIARFPSPRSSKQKEAWEKNKYTVKKALLLKGKFDNVNPVEEILVPHVHGLEDEGKDIPIFFQLPNNVTKENPSSLLIYITGLDGYRTDLVVWSETWNKLNIATLIIEIPGTGDCPSNPNDPKSFDRLFESLISWINKNELINKEKICCWGFSTGSYYSIRLSHLYPKYFSGIVALGGGCHYMFEKLWLNSVNHLEYPFDLANTLAYKWGYGDDVEKFKEEASDKFSLLKDGTLDKPCSKLLLVNGTEDEIFPIDDYYLLLQHGSAKEARFIKGMKHMGEPLSFPIVLDWLYEIFDINYKNEDHMKTIPFKSKFP